MSVEPKRCAATYEANKDVVDAHIGEVLPNILDNMKWPNNELILDHGCGSGSTTLKYLATYAEKSNSTIYALDNSESMIQFGSENFGHPAIKYVHGTVTSDSSAVKDLKFKKIFSLCTLFFVKDYRSELKALYDLLEPNGELYLTTVLYVHTFDLYQQIKEFEHFANHAEDHLVNPKWLTESDEESSTILKDAFLETGFEIKEFESRKKTFVFKSPAVYADMIFALNAFAKHLPDDQYDELKEMYHNFFRNTETETYKPNVEDGNSGYTFPYDALYVLLKKPASVE